MIEIEIDGQKLNAASGSMIIEVADSVGIKIPRFCYHKKLSIAANCRMCLIDVEKAPKPLPACATPVTPGMKIFTQSMKARDAQKSVMEFLLINHPLDCPICDQGGSCELQDISLTYGNDFSRYEENKRVIKDENLGSLIATDMTRCIQCTRCVRFGQEVAGQRELGAIGRGDRMEIGSYLKSQVLKSELSGNMIDLCPVGALTSKPFRFTARAWELAQAESIAPHDGVGSNVYIQTLLGKVMRVVPKENDSVNETWISDRDRFSYQGLYSPNRLSQPIIKNDQGIWQETDWISALDRVDKKLRAVLPHEIAAFASPNATLEEFYLLQKWMRQLGSPHIDHRLRETENSPMPLPMPVYPSLGMPIADIQNQDIILIIGSHISHAHPLVAHRIRKAFLQGAKILCINSVDYDFAFDCTEKHIIAPDKIVEMLSQENLFSNYLEVGLDKNKNLKRLIVLGESVFHHPQASHIRAQAHRLADKYQATIGYLPIGANNAGGWIAGCVPHRGPFGESLSQSGYSVAQAIQAKLQAYILFNIDPLLDLAQSHLGTISEALAQAQCVIAFSGFTSENLLKQADIILPICLFTENSGTYVNAQGLWQSFEAASVPVGESRPAWKILRVLGNFNYMSVQEITQEMSQKMKHFSKNLLEKPFKNSFELGFSAGAPDKNKMLNKKQNKIQNPEAKLLHAITEWPIYRTDFLTRESVPLQQSLTNEAVCIKLNYSTVLKYELQDIINANIKTNHACQITLYQGSTKAVLNCMIDARIPDDCVWIPLGFPETVGFSSSLPGAPDLKIMPIS